MQATKLQRMSQKSVQQEKEHASNNEEFNSRQRELREREKDLIDQYARLLESAQKQAAAEKTGNVSNNGIYAAHGSTINYNVGLAKSHGSLEEKQKYL